MPIAEVVKVVNGCTYHLGHSGLQPQINKGTDSDFLRSNNFSTWHPSDQVSDRPAMICRVQHSAKSR